MLASGGILSGLRSKAAASAIAAAYCVVMEPSTGSSDRKNHQQDCRKFVLPSKHLDALWRRLPGSLITSGYPLLAIQIVQPYDTFRLNIHSSGLQLFAR